MAAMDRGGMATSVLGPYGLPPTPVDNRVFLPTASGYSDDGAIYDRASQAAALQLLAASGYTDSGGVLDAPGGGPVRLTLWVGPGDAVGRELAAQVATSCAAIGTHVTVSLESTAGALPAGWEMAIEQRQVPVYPSQVASRYMTGGPANVDGYSSAAMDALLAEIPVVAPSQLPVLYDQVDAQAWRSFVDLPLVQVPVTVVWGPKLLNVEPGPYFGDIAWDEQDWGFQAS